MRRRETRGSNSLHYIRRGIVCVTAGEALVGHNVLIDALAIGVDTGTGLACLPRSLRFTGALEYLGRALFYGVKSNGRSFWPFQIPVQRILEVGASCADLCAFSLIRFLACPLRRMLPCAAVVPFQLVQHENSTRRRPIR